VKRKNPTPEKPKEKDKEEEEFMSKISESCLRS
jgi:hypothetical protein